MFPQFRGVGASNGATLFQNHARLAEDGGDPAIRASFQKLMSGNFDNANGAPFPPLELFVMELFRVISPNCRKHLGYS